MASLKNSPGQYCLEQQRFKDQERYLNYKYQQLPYVSKLPGLGINPGGETCVVVFTIMFYLTTHLTLSVIYLVLDKLI